MIFLALELVSLGLVVWGWRRWLRTEVRFPHPAWRSGTAFFAFLLATCSVLLAVSSLIWTLAIGGFPFYDPVLLWFYRWGFFLAASGLLLGLPGKGKLWAPAVVSSFLMASLWILAASAE